MNPDDEEASDEMFRSRVQVVMLVLVGAFWLALIAAVRHFFFPG